MKFTIFLSLILYQVVEQLACNRKLKPTDEEAAQIWDYYVKDHQRGKENYTTPSEIQLIPLDKKAAYGKWLMNTVLQKREEKRRPVLHWVENLNIPAAWKDQNGESGQLPPPWAYVPDGHYRPLYCYDHFDKGKCTLKHKHLNLTRWGYNHWLDMCAPFQYSGCGGNQNKFMWKEECEDACRSPVVCCDPPNVDYPTEYFNIGEIKTTKAPS